jgi:hypothetical protein
VGACRPPSASPAAGALPAAALRARGAAPHGGACCCGFRGFASAPKDGEPAAEKAQEPPAEDAAPGEEGAPSVQELLTRLATLETQLEEHTEKARAHSASCLRGATPRQRLRLARRRADLGPARARACCTRAHCRRMCLPRQRRHRGMRTLEPCRATRARVADAAAPRGR